MRATAHSRRGWILLALTGVLALLSYVGLSIRHRRTLAPPEGVKNLEQFAAVMPPPLYLNVGEAREKEYLVWSAPMASTIYLPSGPPGYAFDHTGALVDWSADQGDDLGFRERWPTEPEHQLSLDEALKRFRIR